MGWNSAICSPAGELQTSKEISQDMKDFYVAATRAKQNLYMSYTLESQPVSEFISDASESASLKMNREDLQYQAEKRLSPEERKRLREEAQFEREMLRQLVAQARQELFDYYATGNHYCPGIILEYQDIRKQGPDAILVRARELGMA